MKWRALLFIPPVLIGVGVFYVMQPEPSPKGTAAPEFATPVRVQTVARVPFQAEAAGYGRVRAERSWSAIAQVEGRIADLPDGLAVGRVVPDGALLVRTDPRDYEIALAKADAALAGAEAEMAEIDVEERNTNSSLTLEREVEQLLQVEFDRQQTLAERGTVARTTADAANRALLAQRKVVTNLENELARYPAQRVTLEAEIRRARADREQAKRDLDNTLIDAPFTGRVASESIEIGQYVRQGDTLLSLEAIDASEITAEFQPHVLGAMIRSLVQGDMPPAIDLSGDTGPLPLFAHFGISAEVVIRRQDRVYRWPAEISRFTGTIDDDTGAVGIVVRIADAQRPNPENRRPPLSNGSFAEVVLSAPAEAGLLIPRDAVHGDADGNMFVYLMDEAARLEKRMISRGPVVGGRVVVRDGLESGDRLLLSTPQPAVIGMLLAPVDEGA